jgi:hypothetical protein
LAELLDLAGSQVGVDILGRLIDGSEKPVISSEW